MMRPRFKNAATNHSTSPFQGLSPTKPRSHLTKALYASLIVATLTLLYIVATPSKLGNMDLTYLKTDDQLASKLIKLQQKRHDNTTYDLALKESEGFFTDISSNQWLMLKAKAHSMQPNTRGDPNGPESSSRPSVWFQQHYEPEFICPFERRIGRLGDGGKWICDPHRITMQSQTSDKPDCLVYSIGSNGDASFEAAILKDVGECEIHVFDFGDFADSVKTQTHHSPNVFYHLWGISSYTGGKFKTLEDTARLLGHVGRTIDIFKIDCEGCELDTYSSWLEADVVLRQIVVEIHPSMTWLGAKIKMPETMELFESLKKAGYVITHKEPNVQFAQLKLCVEYNFLKLSPEFWNDKSIA